MDVQDTITGLLLAGTGHVSEKGKKNFLVVDSSQSGQLGREHAAQSDCCPNSKPETSTSTLEAAFNDFTERPDIAILLINQHIAERIRPLMEQYTQAFPAVLEIPSKDHPYVRRCLKTVSDDETCTSDVCLPVGPVQGQRVAASQEAHRRVALARQADYRAGKPRWPRQCSSV